MLHHIGLSVQSSCLESEERVELNDASVLGLVGVDGEIQEDEWDMTRIDASIADAMPVKQFFKKVSGDWKCPVSGLRSQP